MGIDTLISQVIFGIVDKLKCFSRYTPLIKREIAKVVYFQQFEDGRVIVKQGECPSVFWG